MMFLVFAVCFAFSSFTKVSAPRRRRGMIAPRYQLSPVSQSRSMPYRRTRFTARMDHEMRKSFDEIIKRCAYAESLHHMYYVQDTRQPRDLYDEKILTSINKYWAEVTKICLKDELPLRRNPSNLDRDLKTEQERLKLNVQAQRSSPAQRTQEQWSDGIYQSAVGIFNELNEFKRKYGIPTTLGSHIESFLRSYSIETIASDIYNGIQQSIQIESEIPDRQKSKQLSGMLRMRIPYFDPNDLNIEFDGFQRFWKGMIGVMQKRIREPYNSENSIDELYCGQVLFNAQHQYVCRDLRNQFNFLTLKEMNSLTPEMRI